MAIGNGFITLHRKLLDSAVFDNPNDLKVWIWCLLRANHAQNTFFFGGEEITVGRGQFIFGRFTASSELKMNPSTIYKILKKLERAGMIEIKSNNKNSLLSVIKYETYQNRDTRGEQQSNNKVTTEEQQSNTNNNVTRINNVTKEPLVIAPSHDTDSFKVAFFNFTRHRKEIKKPLTPLAEQATLKKLYKHDVATAIKMIEESISNGWQGIFELKGTTHGRDFSTGRKSDATTRATFKHSEQQIQDLRDFEETLKQRYPERN